MNGSFDMEQSNKQANTLPVTRYDQAGGCHEEDGEYGVEEKKELFKNMSSKKVLLEYLALMICKKCDEGKRIGNNNVGNLGHGQETDGQQK